MLAGGAPLLMRKGTPPPALVNGRSPPIHWSSMTPLRYGPTAVGRMGSYGVGKGSQPFTALTGGGWKAGTPRGDRGEILRRGNAPEVVQTIRGIRKQAASKIRLSQRFVAKIEAAKSAGSTSCATPTTARVYDADRDDEDVKRHGLSCWSEDSGNHRLSRSMMIPGGPGSPVIIRARARKSG